MVHGCEVVSSDVTPIRSIIVADNQKAEFIQENMLKNGYYVSCIRPPTVPQHSARIRVSINCHHTEQQIESLLSQFGKLIKY